MGTFHAIKLQFKNLSDMALLCVGICEECAETCEKYEDEMFTECAIACRKCSKAISYLTNTSVE